MGNNIPGKESTDALKKFMKDNGLQDLIEFYGEKKEKIDFSKYGKTRNKNKIKTTPEYNEDDSISEENIIKVNLIKNDEQSIPIYGIKKLLKTTLYILKRNNPFNNFIELEKLNNNIQEYIKKLKYDIKLSEKEEKDFIQNKKLIKDIMINISEENYLFSLIKCTDDIIIKSRKSAEKCVYLFMIGGFFIGFIPYVDWVISYFLYAGMIIEIGDCYCFSFEEIPWTDFFKLIFGFDCKISKTAIKEKEESKAPNLGIIQNAIGITKITMEAGVGKFIGEKIGSKVAKEVGEKKVIEWGIRHLRFARKGFGRKIFDKEIKEVALKESIFNKVINAIMQIFPSMKEGYKEGVQKTAESLGKDIHNMYFNNTKKKFVGLTKDGLIKNCEERGADYSKKVVKESVKNVDKLSKVFTGLGFIVGGLLSCYNTYSTGNNAIQYFDDYITRTLGCDYVIRQKNIYNQIFYYLDEASKEDYEKFDCNIYLLSNIDYRNYIQ